RREIADCRFSIAALYGGGGERAAATTDTRFRQSRRQFCAGHSPAFWAKSLYPRSSAFTLSKPEQSVDAPMDGSVSVDAGLGRGASAGQDGARASRAE